MRHQIVAVTLLLPLATVIAAGYAAEPPYYNEPERRRVTRPERRPPVALPAAVPERQKLQRRERQSSGENASSFRSPETVSIDRLKLRSDTVAEYQFESLSIINQQITDSEPQEQEQQSPRNETDTEDPQQVASEPEAEESPTEQAVDEVADSYPSEHGNGQASLKILTSGGNAAFRIIEDNHRIIVVQVDSAPSTGDKTR